MNVELSVSQVQAKIQALAASHPDWTNPVVVDEAGFGRIPGPRCVYLDPLTEHRCIIGQLAFEEGWKLAGVADEFRPASQVAKANNWPLAPAAIKELDVTQSRADRLTHMGLAWGHLR
jgi:hypothetical protein